MLWTFVNIRHTASISSAGLPCKAGWVQILDGYKSGRRCFWTLVKSRGGAPTQSDWTICLLGWACEGAGQTASFDPPPQAPAAHQVAKHSPVPSFEHSSARHAALHIACDITHALEGHRKSEHAHRQSHLLLDGLLRQVTIQVHQHLQEMQAGTALVSCQAVQTVAGMLNWLPPAGLHPSRSAPAYSQDSFHQLSSRADAGWHGAMASSGRPPSRYISTCITRGWF